MKVPSRNEHRKIKKINRRKAKEARQARKGF